MTHRQINGFSKFCRIFAVFTIAATVFFTAVYFYTFSPDLIFTGFLFLFVALSVNFIGIGALAIISVLHRYYPGFRKTLLIALANIPVSIICVLFVAYLLQTLILTIDNQTDAKAENFNLLCSEAPSVSIDPQSTKTVWIDISAGPCTGNATYTLAGRVYSVQITKEIIKNGARATFIIR